MRDTLLLVWRPLVSEDEWTGIYLCQSFSQDLFKCKSSLVYFPLIKDPHIRTDIVYE